MILVTGGTGLVGAHLLWELVVASTPVRAIYRTLDSLDAVKSLFNDKASGNDGLDGLALYELIDWHWADVIDVPSLVPVFEGINQVYHCAAMISFNPKDFDQMQKVNVEGTANLINLSLTGGIDKFCMVSSVAALGQRPQPVDEETQWDMNACNSGYGISKFASEMEVWRGTQEGLDAVIVNPGIIVGEGFYGSGSGGFFRQVDKGFPFMPPGSNGFVDVLDVVAIMRQLMQSDIKNECYLLVAENATYADFFKGIAQNIDAKTPIKMVKAWQLGLAWRLDYLSNLLFAEKRKLFRENARSAWKTVVYDNSKVKNALDFKFIPLAESMARVGSHFKRTGAH